MPNTIEGIEAEINKVVKKNGPMTHNLCGMLLRKLAKLDKARAYELFEQLCNEGYL